MLEKEIGISLQKASTLEGVTTSHGEDETAVAGGYLDHYILTNYIGQLLVRGEIKIEISPEVKIDYLKKLLHIKE